MSKEEVKKCLRCDGDMIHLEQTCLQLGESTMLTGDPLKIRCQHCGREYYSYYQSCPKCTLER